jgi:Secretion system C-terminal sorting domain
MKRLFTIALTLVLSMAAGQLSAQTVLFTQSFDSTTSWPSGWYATPNSWYLDTTNGNISSGYNNASGGNNIVIKDTTATPGYDSLISPAINTTGHNNITVEWGARFSRHYADSGSTIGLYWSANGSAWTSVSYTENSNNSTWALENGAVPVALPAGAANQSNLKLMWLADIHFTPSGTYRIDDVSVAGTVIAGINEVDPSFAHVYANGKNIYVQLMEANNQPLEIQVYDMTGRLVATAQTENQTYIINAQNLSGGIYIVKVSSSEKITTSKVSIK